MHFDSIFQLYAACYLDSHKFKQYADNNKSDFITLVKRFCNWETMDIAVDERATLLHSTFDKIVKIQRKILQLDCYMSVIDMFIGLCSKNPVLYSMTEEKRCPSCSNHYRTMKTSLPLRCANLDIGNLSKSIHFKDQSKPCEKCNVGMNLENERTLNPVVIVDLDGTQNPEISIAQMQQFLILHGKKFQLRGLIESTGDHFIAHALRADGLWHTYDDLRPASAKTIPESTVLHPVFLLYCQTESICDSPRPEVLRKIMDSKYPIVRLCKYKMFSLPILIYKQLRFIYKVIFLIARVKLEPETGIANSLVQCKSTDKPVKRTKSVDEPDKRTKSYNLRNKN